MLVEQVGETLSRAHALFATAPDTAARLAQTSGARLATAADLARHGRAQMGTLTGTLPAAYGDRAGNTAGALDDAAVNDHALSDGLARSAAADRDGRAHTGAVLRGANVDAAMLAPEAGTAAGQRALVAALRQRLAEQQRILGLYRARGARLAAMLRGLSYRSHRTSGGKPWQATPFGLSGAPRGLPPHDLPNVGGPLTALARERGLAPPRASRGGHAVLGSLSRDSTPRDVAAAIIGEAQRRGYSARQSIAILATAMQESGLRPRAVSPNGLWESIFQQDGSYPGRRDPNLAITGFFDRLGAHGGPAATDIWKAIFWLQQRPGEPTAAAAYAHGRHGYLSEIMNQREQAAALYREIAGES